MPAEVENLEAYLTHARNVLKKFENFVGWDPPDVTDDKGKHVTCPYNKDHRMPTNRLDNHLKTCKYRQFGYTSEEIKEIIEQEHITEQMKDPNVVNTDEIIADIAPGAGLLRNNKHYICALKPEQRLAVYNSTASKCYSTESRMPDKALYADMEAKAAEKLYERDNPENLSEVEIKQKLRDMKRRRQSYRAKNVHITQRSQTEIIRNVLEVHMEELSKRWIPEKPPGAKEGSSNRSSGNSQEHRKDSHRKETDSSKHRAHESSYEKQRESRESYYRPRSRDRRGNEEEYKDVASSRKEWEVRESSSRQSSRDRRGDDEEYKNMTSSRKKWEVRESSHKQSFRDRRRDDEEYKDVASSGKRREARESSHKQRSGDRRGDDEEYKTAKSSHKKRRDEKSEKKHKKEKHKSKKRKQSKSKNV